MTRRFIILASVLVLGGPAFCLRAAPEVLELPPLVVEENQHGAQWLYGRVEGLEFISLCSEDQTRSFITGVYRAHQVLRLLIPESLQIHLSVPTQFILYPTDREQSLSSAMIDEMKRVGEQEHAVESKVHILPGLRIDDDDSTEVFVMLGEAQTDWISDINRQITGLGGSGSQKPTTSPEGLAIQFGYAQYLLQNRTPPPPAWLSTGLIAVFQTCDLAQNSIAVNPSSWISAEATQALIQNGDAPRTLLPLAQVFEAPAPSDHADAASVARRQVWTAESALFVRWAFSGGDATRIAAFKRFAEHSCEEAVDEAYFRDCFGMGYSQMRDELSDYLPIAVGERFGIVGTIQDTPAFTVRNAATPEVSRMMGDWARRASHYMLTRSEPASRTYSLQAQHMFERGLATGVQDPALFADAGIFYYNRADTARAKPLLEKAVAASVIRPDAYFLLARIVYAEEITHPLGLEAGKLSVAQRDKVGSIILRGLAQDPQTPALFSLLTDIEYHSDASVNDPYLERLDRGARLYPSYVALVYRSAVLEAVRGDPIKAAGLIAEILRRDLSAAEREKFLELQAKLSTVN